MRPSLPRPILPAFLLAAAGVGIGPLEARVDVTLDAESLNALLAAAGSSQHEIRTPVGSLRLELSDLRVTGFDPAGGNPHAGWILTSARVRIPQTGLDSRLEPRISVQVHESGGAKSCYLKFERMELDLRPVGRLDVASMLPPIHLAPDVSWVMPTAVGPKTVRPRLVDARVGTQHIRLSFDLDIGRDSEPAHGGSQPSN